MIAQRVGVSGLRKVAKPNAFLSYNLPRLPSGAMQARPVTTSKYTEDDAQAILAAQRKKRPVSPHMEIYDKSQVFFGASIWTRITGMVFTGGLYGYSAAYLVAPLLGWHLESASLVAAFGALPAATKGALKFLVAWPFMFHFINGCRHFAFDFAKGFSKTTINQTGYAVGGLSLVTALGMVAFL